MEKLISNISDFKVETNKDGILGQGVSNNVNSILNIPVWAKEDFFIKDIITSGKGCFVVIRSFQDEYLDNFKPPYHRGYIYFDGSKYYIKRWKVQYIGGVPFRMCAGNGAEEILIDSDKYGDLTYFSKEEFLLKNYDVV